MLLLSAVPVWSSVNISGKRLSSIHPRVGYADGPEGWDKIHKQVVDGQDWLLFGLSLGKTVDSSCEHFGYAIVIYNSNSSFRLSLSLIGHAHCLLFFRAYDIIRLKGYTNWAVGMSCSALLSSILGNKQIVHPVSCFVKVR